MQQRAPIYCGILLLLALQAASLAQTPPTNRQPAMNDLSQPSHLNEFQVIEFRRYQLKDGARAQFARYFESYFPEAFQQLGAIAFGQFAERKNPAGFTWMRGFQSMEARAIANAAFYYGPVWKEHRNTLNELIVDSDNVLLLRPLHPDSGVALLPAVDPVLEAKGAQGILIAQIFAVKAGSVDAFAGQAGPAFARYRAAGARQAGVLVTLDAANNFPQLPVRTDGPYLIWLGLVEDDSQLATQLVPALDAVLAALSATGLLRGAPETVILEPTARSRLRWLPQ